MDRRADRSRTVMKQRAAALTLMLFAVVARAQTPQSGPRRPQISIALAPPVIEKIVRPSGHLTDTISLTNNSVLPVIVSVDFADFHVTADGQVQELPPGTDPESSLAAYLKITPLKIRVEPQGRAFFKYSVDAPEAFKQLRTQVFFTAVPVVPNSANQVTFVPRLGVPLYVESTAAKPAALHADHIEWKRSPDNQSITLSLSLRNEGERNIRPQGFVEVRSADGKFSKTFPFNEGNEPVLPGQQRAWNRVFGPVPGGDLSIRLRFETSPRTSFDQQYRIAPSGS